MKKNNLREEWRDIPGLNGKYQVSSFSRARSITNRGIKIIRGHKGKRGYYDLRVYINKKYGHMTLHRALALAFIPNPENKREVNHIDMNRANNALSNLEWATPKENINHSKIRGQFKKRDEFLSKIYSGENCRFAKLSWEDVNLIRNIYSKGETTHRDLAIRFSISRSNIENILRNKTWKHNGSEAKGIA